MSPDSPMRSACVSCRTRRRSSSRRRGASASSGASAAWTGRRGGSGRICPASRIPCAVSSRRSTCSGPPARGLYGFPSLATAPMPRDRSRDDEDDEEEENFWKGLGKDLLVAAIIVVVFLGIIYAYAGVWPPLV